MKLTFTFYDAQEISSSTYRAFISTFQYKSDKSDSEVSDSDVSDSDLSDYDPSIFECSEITPEVESMVENSWEVCKPLDEVFGATASDIIKETVTTATEETQCVGLNFFREITPGENRELITTCTAVSYWCCCETIKKVSPILAEATINLFY